MQPSKYGLKVGEKALIQSVWKLISQVTEKTDLINFYINCNLSFLPNLEFPSKFEISLTFYSKLQIAFDIQPSKHALKIEKKALRPKYLKVDQPSDWGDKTWQISC